jgi:hypothetical protein
LSSSAQEREGKNKREIQFTHERRKFGKNFAHFTYRSDVSAMLTGTVMVIIRRRSMPASSPAGNDSNIYSYYLINERAMLAGVYKDWVL